MPVARCRSGLTLPEVLLALVLLGLVGGVLTRALLVHQRATRRLVERAAAGTTLDQGLSWLAAEFGDLQLADSNGDLLRAAPESLSYRAWRGAGLACSLGPTEVVVRLQELSGWRLPQVGRDSMLLFTGGGVLTPVPGRWVALPITSVGPGACGVIPALRLGTSVDTASLAPSGLPPLIPVRTFEVMQSRLYQSQGEWWLGARSESGGEAVQPVLGPLAAAGMRIGYRDSTGVTASSPAATRELQIRMRTGAPALTGNLELRPRNSE